MQALFLDKTFENIIDLKINETPFYATGEFLGFIEKISLEGFITSTGEENINGTKFDIQEPLNQTGDLTLGGTIFSNLVFDSISYSDSDFDVIQPYTASFTQVNSFIKNASDEWVAEEQDNKIVSVSHNVRASLDSEFGNDTGQMGIVKAFVQDRIQNSSPNFAFYNTGQYIEESRTETFNQIENLYQASRTYNYMDESSTFSDRDDITQVSIGVDYNSESEDLVVKANGFHSWGLTETGVDIISEDDMLVICNQYVLNSVDSAVEGYSPDGLVPTEKSFVYDSGDRTINFSYTFEEVGSENLIGEENNVLHDYSVNYKIDKIQDPIPKVSVRGSLSYVGIDNPNTGTINTGSARWNAIEDAFRGLNLEAVATTDLNDFLDSIYLDYKLGNLNRDITGTGEYNINKDLENNKIDYSYDFTTKEPLTLPEGGGKPSGLYNLSFTKDVLEPSQNQIIKETTNGFISQSLGAKVGSVTIRASASNDSGGMEELEPLVLANLFYQNKSAMPHHIKDSSKEFTPSSVSFEASCYVINIENLNTGEQ